MTPAELRSTRERLGLTQGAAARLVGVDGRAWRYWEAGARHIPASVCLLLALMDEVPEARSWLTQRQLCQA